MDGFFGVFIIQEKDVVLQGKLEVFGELHLSGIF
jgi:hypothetical protein